MRSSSEGLSAAARSLEIAADLNNLAKASTLGAVPMQLQPTANAAAYADYVARLGLKCTEEDAPVDIEAAALRHAAAGSPSI